MTTLTSKHFDSLSYVKQAKKLGASEELAELQARQIEQAIDIAVATIKDEINLKDLASKQDLLKVELKIEQLRNELIKWIIGSGITGVLAIAGLLKLMVH